ncbi:MAG: flagellin FliC [Bdellovibrionales bacterium]|nr:flagellin FliC [Bdellovibrionales bacterium]
MGMRITTNISAVKAARQLSGNQMNIESATEKLSSGYRINKAADDAAGLSVSEMMRNTIRSVRQASRNANDGISLIQTAEGGLNEIANIVIRLRELGVQASSDTVGENERQFIQTEVTQLTNEVNRIAAVTRWGKTILLDGQTPSFEIQVGINNDDFEDRITFDPSLNNATLDGLDLTGLDFTEQTTAQEALSPLDDALIRVNEMRSNIGAIETRLVHTIENQSIYEENMTAAKSRIRDTDVADATSTLASSQVLLNASISTLAQANSLPQQALRLLS